MHLHIFPYQTLPAHINMATDMALLEYSQKLTFRHYSWQSPCHSFGYTQKYSNINLNTPLIRRPTSGGIVNHSNDFTYSLIIPNSHPWFHLKIPTLYHTIHSILQNTFSHLNIPTQLQSTCSPCSQHCFQGTGVLHDLLIKNQKIAGAALKRTKHALLLQGSIQKSPINHINWQDFQQILTTNLAQNASLKIQHLKHTAPADLIQKYANLFKSSNWLKKR